MILRLLSLKLFFLVCHFEILGTPTRDILSPPYFPAHRLPVAFFPIYLPSCLGLCFLDVIWENFLSINFRSVILFAFCPQSAPIHPILQPKPFSLVYHVEILGNPTRGIFSITSHLMQLCRHLACLLPYLSSLLPGILFSRCDLRKLLIHQFQTCATLRLLSSIRANPPNPSTCTSISTTAPARMQFQQTFQFNYSMSIVLSPKLLISSSCRLKERRWQHDHFAFEQ